MKTNTKFKKAKNFKINQQKFRDKALRNGVELIAPETTFLSKDTKFGKNVVIEPYVVIGPKVKIGNNVIIKSFSHLEGTIIKNNVAIGPYARLRTGTSIFQGQKSEIL